MAYATLSGFEEYDAAAYAEFAARNGESAERVLGECEARMAAYVIPNSPQQDPDAFESAVYAQAIWENSPGNAQLAEMPGGLKSFSVNGFSAAFAGGGQGEISRLFPAGVARAAYAILLEAGLLYKGVSVC